MEEKKETMRIFFDQVADTYDVVHVGHLDGGMESKQIVAQFIPSDAKKILDLGIGTGLELERIFEKFKDIEIIGIDCSSEMLKRLKEKFPTQPIELICDSYFNYDFNGREFDAIISVMSLHHYPEPEKELLFKKIYDGLKPGGVFINSDYIIDSQEEQDRLFHEFEQLKKQQDLLHFDTPLTETNEIKLLRKVGFSDIEKVWYQGNTKVLVAMKN